MRTYCKREKATDKKNVGEQKYGKVYSVCKTWILVREDHVSAGQMETDMACLGRSEDHNDSENAVQKTFCKSKDKSVII